VVRSARFGTPAPRQATCCHDAPCTRRHVHKP
jgi:hypothetical protein